MPKKQHVQRKGFGCRGEIPNERNPRGGAKGEDTRGNGDNRMGTFGEGAEYVEAGEAAAVRVCLFVGLACVCGLGGVGGLCGRGVTDGMPISRLACGNFAPRAAGGNLRAIAICRECTYLQSGEPIWGIASFTTDGEKQGA